MAKELARKDADGRRAAAHTHALLGHAIDDGRAAGLDDELRATVDGELHRLLVAQRLHHLGGDAAFLLGAAREVVHTTQRQHLRAVLCCGHMAHHLALAAHVGLFGSEEAVGVDLHLEAAVAEDALGDHGDHVHAVGLGAHDEGRRLVVRVGGGRAHARHEHFFRQQQVAVPCGFRSHFGPSIFCSLGAARKRHQRGLTRLQRLAQQHHRVQPHQHARLIGVAVASACAAFGNLAQHRARIALDLGGVHALVARPGALQHLRQLWRIHTRQPIGLGVFSHRGDPFIALLQVLVRALHFV